MSAFSSILFNFIFIALLDFQHPNLNCFYKVSRRQYLAEYIFIFHILLQFQIFPTSLLNFPPSGQERPVNAPGTALHYFPLYFFTDALLAYFVEP